MENIFRIKSYGRTQLAKLYCPELTTNAAWKKFKGWIEGCRELKDRLLQLGYDGKHRNFSPAQVKAIVEFLDEP